MGHLFEAGELGLHLARLLRALEGDECATVVHRVTVVGSREDGDAVAVMCHLITLVFNLSRPRKQPTLTSLLANLLTAFTINIYSLENRHPG